MPLLPWIDPENFNPGYLMRGMHLLPKRGDKPEWQHTQDYWTEKDDSRRSTSTTAPSSTKRPVPMPSLADFPITRRWPPAASRTACSSIRSTRRTA